MYIYFPELKYYKTYWQVNAKKKKKTWIVHTKYQLQALLQQQRRLDKSINVKHT